MEMNSITSNFSYTGNTVKTSTSNKTKDSTADTETIEEYKSRINSEIDKIPFHSSHRKDIETLVISEEGYQAMKNDSEYEKWVLSHIRENRSVNLSMMTNRSDYISGTDYEYIGASKEECYGQSYNNWDYSKNPTSSTKQKSKFKSQSKVDYSDIYEESRQRREVFAKQRDEAYFTHQDKMKRYYQKDIETDKSSTEQSAKDKLLEGMNSCKEMELIPIDKNLPHEIYAFTISDGKVQVQGGEGYEKLLNASLTYQFQWKWGSRAMEEETVLNALTDMLKYYSGIDNEIVKNDSSDSIVHHVNEAFDRWYQENKPAHQSFLAKA